MSPNRDPKPPVRQLRLVVEAAAYDAAVRFYRDALGLTEEESFEGEVEARGIVLDAGRATLELHNPAQRKMVDGLEADGIPSGHIRVAFEVADTAEKTQALTDAGAAIIASPRVTPWQSPDPGLEAEPANECGQPLRMCGRPSDDLDDRQVEEPVEGSDVLPGLDSGAEDDETIRPRRGQSASTHPGHSGGAHVGRRHTVEDGERPLVTAAEQEVETLDDRTAGAGIS
ncbi:hypothetical protein SAMN05216282_12533 [Cryobacterium psychrotolerans]|uniref:VOC domain-containing protein n=1 Tax=Cryobacterium psychrotolerans TaxID=386301 RepID=A0A1G9H1H3_9MICO|nr:MULTISPECIES: VOC family protein [Cryobacterium]SDL06715.1 hypothetical protein SAMN05216282_12533 [Cryobacterium psychrotolerans]